MKKAAILLLGLLYLGSALAFDHQHAKLDQVLKEVVVADGHHSMVDYGKLKSNPDVLLAYLEGLESVTASDYTAWPRENKLAFLINAYNAFTLQLILKKYPDLKSIKDLGSLFSSPWKQEFFMLFGEPASLDMIEHDLLRPLFAEPRIHFAIVCASISCPPLQSYAYVGTDIELQLEKVTVNFLTDVSRNYYDPARRTLFVSKIFKWFARDFTETGDSVQAFILSRLAAELNIDPYSVTIDYLDYDWTLNDI